jgi:hypothetical protein
MECKHGTSEPCDLCAEEDEEHDREMAIQARIDAAVAAERERCAKVCDGVALNPSAGDDSEEDAATLCARLIRGA